MAGSRQRAKVFVLVPSSRVTSAAATAAPTFGAFAFYLSATVLVVNELVHALIALTIAQTAGSLFAAPIEASFLTSGDRLPRRFTTSVGLGSFAGTTCLVALAAESVPLALCSGTFAVSTYFLRFRTTSTYRREALHVYSKRNVVEVIGKVLVLVFSLLNNEFHWLNFSAAGVILFFSVSQVLTIYVFRLLTNSDTQVLEGNTSPNVYPRGHVFVRGFWRQMATGTFTLLQLSLAANLVSSAGFARPELATFSFALLRGPSLVLGFLRPAILSSTSPRTPMPNSITLACVMGGLCAAGFTAFEWADKGSGITHAFLLGACQPFVLLPVYNAIRRQRFTQCILISGVNLFLTASFIFTFGSSTVPILTLFLITIWFGKRLEHLE